MSKKDRSKPLKMEFKKEIAEYVFNSISPPGRKKLAKKFNISEDQARYILKNLDNFRSAVSNGDQTYIKCNQDDIKSNFYNLAIDKIKKLRALGYVINYETINKILHEIKNIL